MWGGVIGPVLFGYLLDKGMASGVLWASVCFMAITTAMVLFQERKEPIRPTLVRR